MDKLTALTVFRRVAELKSFSQAARDLRLSPTAVSKNVRELEAALGARLLHRTTRSVQLTSTGESYYLGVVDVLERLGQADDGAAEAGRSPRGLLRVAAPMSLGVTLVAPAVASFSLQHPQLRIEVDMNDRYVDLVQEGFDVGLRGGGPLPDSSLVARRLASIERIVCAAPNYLSRHGVPRAPQDLAKHRCLVYTLARASNRWTFRRGRAVRSIDVEAAVRVNSSLALVAAAAAGAGLVLVPAVLAREAIAAGALRAVLGGWRAEPQALFALSPHHRESAPKVKLFVEHLAAALRGHAAAGSAS